MEDDSTKQAALDAAAAPVLAEIDALLATKPEGQVVSMLEYIRDPEHLFDEGLDGGMSAK